MDRATGGIAGRQHDVFLCYPWTSMRGKLSAVRKDEVFHQDGSMRFCMDRQSDVDVHYFTKEAGGRRSEGPLCPMYDSLTIYAEVCMYVLCTQYLEYCPSITVNLHIIKS